MGLMEQYIDLQMSALHRLTTVTKLNILSLKACQERCYQSYLNVNNPQDILPIWADPTLEILEDVKASASKHVEVFSAQKSANMAWIQKSIQDLSV